MVLQNEFRKFLHDYPKADNNKVNTKKKVFIFNID